MAATRLRVAVVGAGLIGDAIAFFAASYPARMIFFTS